MIGVLESLVLLAPVPLVPIMVKHLYKKIKTKLEVRELERWYNR